MSESLPVPVPPPPGDLPAGAGDYEYRLLTIPRGMSRAEARRVIAEHAEYGHWELDRTRIYVGGRTRTRLRRRIIRARRAVSTSR